MKNSLEISTILKEFYSISGFRVSIHDAEFNEIYSYPHELSTYCSAIQKNLKNKKQCHQNDKSAFLKVKETGEVTVYRCSHGLYEAVAPIYHYGILSGYFMMGQVCDNKKEQSAQLYRSAYNVLLDKNLATAAVDSVKEVPEKLIKSYISIMTVIAEFVTETNRLSPLNSNLAVLVKTYINQNYSSKITLELLADRFSCSQSLLIKTFKKEYGTTIMKELMEVRLEKAEEHLRKSRIPLKEIADECGFSDQNYFSKVFAAKHGCSPSEYRKRLNKIVYE